MADTKEGRENQADDEERRQRELAEARDRADEPDPTADDPALTRPDARRTTI